MNLLRETVQRPILEEGMITMEQLLEDIYIYTNDKRILYK